MILILRWILFALAVMLAAWIIPGINVVNIQAALIMALIVGLINTFIRPILSFVTLPINLLTLGIFGLVLNALLLMLAGYFAPGVSIEGFLPALLGSLLLAFLGSVIFQIPDKN